ncbi:serine hydrolase domain-containing protein [Microbacterium sp. B35-04]|uniref:serine hydrolase domain-containing protein n=1 Tax=Microbacterium sp. B35-04 TaxID=1961716 RepID=UPI001EF7B425|nr:serine hydrolase domain-containing protein [Microbacterium sp. B35-04]
MSGSGVSGCRRAEPEHTMTSETTTVRGHFDDGWEAVVNAFAGTVDPAVGGAALAIRHEDRDVVDVYAGTADTRTGRTWAADTPAVLFSSTKGLAAVTVALLVDRGRLDIEAEVAGIWPEFGVHGKSGITIGDVLSHRAGLVAPDAPLSTDELIDNRAFAARLAAQPPLWPGASAHLYHPVTWGPLVSEIVRRATGEEISDIFLREIAAPLAAHATLAPTESEARDVAYVTLSPELELFSTQTVPLLGELAAASLTAGGALPPTLVGDGIGLNDARVLGSGLVSSGGVASALGLARIWAATVARVPLLSAGALASLLRVRSHGTAFGENPDASEGHEWGAGVQLASAALPLLTRRSFGHDGAGGQCGFADPEWGIGFGYVTNRLSHLHLVGPILDAMRSTLERH